MQFVEETGTAHLPGAQTGEKPVAPDPSRHGASRSSWALSLIFLTLVTLLVNGYHPLSEDGGLYVAGVQLTLDPSLFPHYRVFVSEHLGFSVFAPVLAFVVRYTHLSLSWVLMLADLFSIWLTLYAGLRILWRVMANPVAQLAGLGLLSVFWCLPVAGTSLLLMDPYVTARSFSTPLSLLALACALDFTSSDEASLRPIVWSGLWLALAATLHPLMAAYAFGFLVVLFVTRLRRPYLGYIVLAGSALSLAAAMHLFAPPETPALLAAERSRSYWFLSQWQWYELLGLVGPLLVLALLLIRYRRQSDPWNQTAQTLCRTGIALGCISTLVTVIFAQEGSQTHLVARMQPLRVYLMIYAVMTLLLGATLTDMAMAACRRARSSLVRAMLVAAPVAGLLGLAGVMFFVQRQTYPASEPIEVPWRAGESANPWLRAFFWCRANTPPDALFALDTKYVNEQGEDAQTFRPAALRSAVPDYSKDGGEAAITPRLADRWIQGANAQVNLSTETDAERDARLLPLGVTWMVLHASASTAYPCPYNNGVVKVCRLTPEPSR
ncbi:MAG: hypothetical protein ACP5E5_06990 [Acidobacteriaceae bacterium]